MIKRRVAALTLAVGAVLSIAARGQTAVADASPAFIAADVHPSPHTLQPFSRSVLRGDKFTMRQANLVDMIVKAYGVDPDNVVGGPSWLESDHFEIYAKVPPKTSSDSVNLMLRKLLADRFKLVLHTDSKPLPAFVLSVGKGGPKMTEADASSDPHCDYVPPPQNLQNGAIAPIEFSCHNTTMTTFADDLHDWANGYVTNPTVDATGLKGGWDFNIKWTNKAQLAKAGGDGITIFDAVEKQLGLKLEAKTAPLPVVMVDSASETPTPNAPDVAKLLPPPPSPEFEVATVRSSAPDERSNARINGGNVTVQGLPLQFLVTFAYDITDEMLIGAPKWLSVDKFDVTAKAASADNVPGAPQIDFDDLRVMVRKFLEDRFQLKAHMEDRPLDAYTLVAANPKLKKADPTNRTGCKEGPGADGKDPRIATPILGRLLTCRNMTMTQFAAMLQSQASGYIHTSVLNSTGIDGAYDITLSFSSAGQLQSNPNSGGGAGGGDASATAEPNGALSFIDAVNKELGLKLVKGKRPVPSLVIDHIEEKPTEN